MTLVGEHGDTGKVTHVAGKPIEPNRHYKIATTMWSLCNGSAQSWIDWMSAHPEARPSFDAPVLATVLRHFAKQLWRQVFLSIDVNGDGKISAEELKALDTNNDGKVSRSEMAAAMRRAGYEVDDTEFSFVDLVMEAAGDLNHDGFLDKQELGVVG